MNVVDSSGWVEYLLDELNASRFEPPLRDTGSLVVPTVCLYEVFKIVSRHAGHEIALQAVSLMERGWVADLTPDIAVQAATLSIEHALPMADSIILATARLHEATLWTQDADFEGIEGVRYVPKD